MLHDNRFFQTCSNQELLIILRDLDLKLPTDIDKINGLGTIDNQSIENHLTFVIKNAIAGDKYKNAIQTSRALFCLIKEEDLDILPKNIKPIISKNPYLDFLKICDKAIKKTDFSKEIGFIGNGCVLSSNSKIASSAKICDGCVIGDFSTIGDGVIIGKNCVIKNGVHIENGCIIGEKSIIHNSVSMECVTIGNNCEIQAGVTIGQEGFGFIIECGNYKINHYGIVDIGDNVNILSNSVVNRGTFDMTKIGNNSKIDMSCSIAHNVKIGKNVVVAGGTSIAGGVVIEDCCVIGGGVLINGHITIGSSSIIYGGTSVAKSCDSKSKILSGWPGEDSKTWAKKLAIVNKICKTIT